MTYTTAYQIQGCREFAAYLKEHTQAQGLNVLINNSGTSWAAPLESFPDNGWDKVLDINLKSPFWLTQACMPLLEAVCRASVINSCLRYRGIVEAVCLY